MRLTHRYSHHSLARMRWLLISLMLLLAGLSPWPPNPPAVAASSGTPILLILNQASTNPFGPYLAEILRAEGLNSVAIVELSALTQSDLLAHDIAILAETSLNPAQASLLTTYVQGGGALLAMRPDPQIASLFGLGGSPSTITDAYMQISATASLSAGLSHQTLQTHTQATAYPSVSSSTLAHLYSTATMAANAPAVVRATSNRTAAFTYDLATAVIYLRQGNPANTNVDVDGDGIFRTNDLFRGSGTTPPWINLDRLPVPQADEQQRLFARIVMDLLGQPTPQLWYFPGNAKTVLVLTGDAHSNPLSYYQQQLTSLSAHNAPITLYLTIGGGLTDVAMQGFQAQGHSFGIHPYAARPDSYPPYNITTLTEGFQVFDSWYRSTWSTPPSRSYRTHRLGWQGWADAAAIAATHGYALDTDFYHWGTWLRKPDGSWPLGYLTGSGQPMKFVQQDGTILPVYQQLTQLVDEFLLGDITHTYQADYGWVLPQYSAAQAIAQSTALIDASNNGDYAALMTQFHTDYYGFGGPQIWAEGIVDYAHAHQVPVWNADTFLQFVETRAATTYSALSWTAATGTLTFTISGPSQPNTLLSTMLPLSSNGRGLASVTVDGAAQAFSIQTIKGQDRAFVSIPAGNHTVQAVYQPGVILPTTTPTNVPTTTTTSTSVPPTSTPIPPTSTPSPTATLPINGALVHSTLEELSQSCQDATHIQATLGGDAGDGAFSLAAAAPEAFADPQLNPTRWTMGSWSTAAYSPTLADGRLTLPGGGYVRSTTPGAITDFEANASFAAGAWLHLGLADLDFANDRYLLFSTYNGDGNLYARANNGTGEQQLNLGPIPLGSHHYRIIRRTLNASTDQVSFLIDGVLKQSLTIANTGLNSLYTYLSNNTTNAATLVVDQLATSPAVAATGSVTSCVLDAGSGHSWSTISWQAILPSASSMSVQGRISGDGLTWSAWTPMASSGAALPSSTQFAQYQLTLATTDPQHTPLVLEITLGRSTTAGTATAMPPTSTSVPPTSTPVPPTSTPITTGTVTNTPILPTSTPSTTAPGLVAAYSFNANSGTTLSDASGLGHTGTLLNGPTWTTSGHTGAALSFDGVNDLVSIPDAPALDLTTGMTLEAWVYPTTIDNWQTVIFKTLGGNDLAYALYAFSDGNNRPRGFINNGNQSDIGGGTYLPLNTWTHLATSYDGSTIRLYIDGQQVGQRTLNNNILISTGALELGGNTAYGNEWFHGRLDDVRIYNRALSPAEIIADRDTPVGNATPISTPTNTPILATSTPIPPTSTPITTGTATNTPILPTNTPILPTSTPSTTAPGLVAAYSFNANSGTTLSDASGLGHTGTLLNGPTWTTSGHTGAALSFDGVNDLVSIPDAPALDLTTGMTLEAWVYPTTIDNWQTVIFKTLGGNDLAYALYAFSDGNNRPRGFINNGNQSDIGGGTYLPLNTWTHLATSYDGSTIRLYIDGQQVGQRTLNNNILISTGALELGGNTAYGNEWFHGRLDDVRIYNRALSPAEIIADRDTPVP